MSGVIMVRSYLMFFGSLAAKQVTSSLSALLPAAMTQPLKPGFCCSGGSASSNASIKMMTWEVSTAISQQWQ